RSKRDWSSDVCSSDLLKRSVEKDVSHQAVNHLDTLDAGNVENTHGNKELTVEHSDYEQVKNLLKLQESLETANYRHFYIHMDDELRSEEHTSELQSRFDLVCRL